MSVTLTLTQVVNEIELTESAVTLTLAQSVLIVNEGGGGSGANLAYTASPTNGTVTSDTGTDATLTLADGTNAGLMTPANFTKLGGIEASADVTDAANVGAVNAAATSKTTPVNADSFIIVDSETGNAIARVTGTNLKAFLKTYFDTLYQASGSYIDGSGAATHIPFFTDSNTLTSDTHFTYDSVNDVLHVHKLAGDATDGLLIESENGTDIAIMGAANTANVTWYGSHNFNTATASRLAIFGASKTLESADTATYPSLTELAYVKGVTSAIQTQLDAKLAKASVPCEFIVACSDETTAITTGTAKVTFRAPYPFTLTAVRASATTAPTGSTIVIDINESGTSVLSTKLSIDASEKTSTTAATPAVISDSAIADDAEITIDFDQVGSTIAGAGVKVTLIGTHAV